LFENWLSLIRLQYSQDAIITIMPTTNENQKELKNRVPKTTIGAKISAVMIR
jgi:hypothetical protein